jgi:hypothetical protein
MLTQREKTLLKVFTKKRSKEKIQQDMRDFVESNGFDTSKSLEMLLRVMSYENFIPVAIQYLNYANKYYDEIVLGDFSNDIERVASFQITVGATETEVVFVDYTTTVHTLPSLIEVFAEDFMENMGEYDADREIIDYGDTLSTDWDDQYNISPPSKPYFTPTIIE